MKFYIQAVSGGFDSLNIEINERLANRLETPPI